LLPQPIELFELADGNAGGARQLVSKPVQNAKGVSVMTPVPDDQAWPNW